MFETGLTNPKLYRMLAHMMPNPDEIERYLAGQLELKKRSWHEAQTGSPHIAEPGGRLELATNEYVKALQAFNEFILYGIVSDRDSEAAC